jgi:ABC-type nitrate/sulfonate/bicarbonate transport system substrate-binding protein
MHIKSAPAYLPWPRIAALSMLVLTLDCSNSFADDTTPRQPSAAAGQKLTLRVGVQGSLYLPAQSAYAFATEQGAYAKANLNVEWTTVGTVADCARAIAGDSLDACTVEAFGAVNAVKSVPGLRVVAQLTNQDLHYLIANPRIKKVQDLAGEKVGTSIPDSVQTISGKALVKAKGGNPNDSTWISLGSTVTIIQSFENKQIAAAIVVQPFQLTVPGSTILGDTSESTPTYQVLLARPAAVNAQTLAALKRFLVVTSAESDYLINPANEAAIEAAWSKWVKVDPAALQHVYKSYVAANHWVDIKNNKFKIDPEQWKAVAKLESPTLNALPLIDESIQKAAFVL